MPETLFGNGQAAPLTVAGGGFGGYKPLAELAPYAVHIFTLTRTSRNQKGKAAQGVTQQG
jgi:hypothetical protein